MTQVRPESDVDLFSEELADDPFATYQQLRDQAGAVYMRQHDFWALTRYDDVREAAADWRTFTSAEGAALLPEFQRAPSRDGARF